MFNIGMLFKVAWRSLLRNWRRTLITISAISGGVALALFGLAFAYGSHAQIIRDAVRIQSGHITLEHPEFREAPSIDVTVRLERELRNKIEELEGVVLTKALLQGQGVAKSGSGAVGVAVMGVEPERESGVSLVARNIVSGEYLSEGERGKVIVGVGLAKKLKLKAGKKLVLGSNNVDGDVVEQLFRVKGIFKTNSPQLDGHLLQLSVADAQGFYQLTKEQYSQIGVVVEDVQSRDRVMEKVKGITASSSRGPVSVLPWEKVLTELAGMIQIDRASNWIINMTLVFLSLFTIWNTILMSVLERTREFAMMLALGTSPSMIRAQVLVESMIVGFGSVFVGLSLGGGAAFWYKVNGMDLSELMPEGITVSSFAIDPVIHADPRPEMFLWLGAGVFGATVLISYFSSRRVNNISISNVLR